MLSPKQMEVLSYIQDQVSASGRPPTLRDIARSCGDLAVGTVQDHIKALIQKGFIARENGLSRGIRLTHQRGALEVPILGAVPAGNPLEAIQESTGSIPVPSSIHGELFALKVKGESMIDAGILDGDFVVVKKTREVVHGDVVVAMIDGEVTVKTLEKKAGRVRLLPANSRFSPIEVPLEALKSEDFIQGKVVSVQRFL